MRISDWSSDVCSSDLFADPLLRASMFSGFIRTLRPGGILLLEGYRPEQLRFGTGGPKVEENLYTEDLLRESFATLEILDISSYQAELHEGSGQIGRASCRERRGQYG